MFISYDVLEQNIKNEDKLGSVVKGKFENYSACNIS